MPDGSGAAVFDISAFELTEARLLVEGEAAALAAEYITEDELDLLDSLVKEIAQENQRSAGTELADREFHLTIARATRNAALAMLIENLWDVRDNSKPTALLYAKARAADVKPVVKEHRDIVLALRKRDADQTRLAMRSHLSAVLDSLLFATEERDVQEARSAAANRRSRFEKSMTR